jgi:transposase InsO family protein
MLQELRMSRFMEAYEGYRRKELSCIEAGLILGMSERQFRRLRDRYEDEGALGVIDRRLGKASAKRVPACDVAWVVEEYRTKYAGFTAKHFYEKMEQEPRFCWGYTWTKSILQNHGLLVKARKRGAHRKKRERRPLPGMMLHQDGSQHDWLGTGGKLDLIVTMDDATSEIYSAFLVEQESTKSSFSGLIDVIETHGLPCSLYSDRGSHYWLTQETGGKVDKVNLTQVGRALKQLGIAHISAYSPEARGRSERAFGTLQDRLVKELVLAKIQDIASANRFIKDVYLPEHNRRFAVAPTQPGSAFVPIIGGLWRDVLCIQVERQVGNDNTVRYAGMVLQLPPSPERAHFAKATVRVHEYPNGALAIFHCPRRLADYTEHGVLIQTNEEKYPTKKAA